LSVPRETLERECAVLTRYLVGTTPTSYVLAKYVAAHDALEGLIAADRFDALLVRMARGPAVLRAPAAAYARVWRKGGALQNKLVLLLAILETEAGTARILDASPARHPLELALRVATRVGIAALALTAGTLLLSPLRWIWPGARTEY
jgi:hypothetical protein